jgi:hypothetical protein
LPLQSGQTRTLRIVHFTQHKPTIVANAASYAILDNLGSFLPSLESLQSLRRNARPVCV